MKKDYDLLIIGGGSAGLTAARFARRLGLSVVMVEKDRLGGDCTWTGCVPSKTLLMSAKAAHQMRTAEKLGLAPAQPAFDLKPVMAHVKSVQEEIFRAESPETLQSEGIEVVIGEARFLDQRRVAVEGRKITARRFLVCTGAGPVAPPIPGIQEAGYLTYETVWDLEKLPSRLTVVGGGPIGCELAQAFARLGSSVTVVEALDRLLLQDEPEASELIRDRLVSEGVDLRLNASVESAAEGTDGVTVSLSGGSCVETDAVLLAVGRRARLDGLGLDEAGVAYDREGIKVDRNLRTSRKNIYAAGDCIGGYQFTHYAGFQGFRSVWNAFAPRPFSKKAVLERVPWATFTDPEVAHVGLTEAQAREQRGDKVMAAFLPMSRVDRALTDGDSSGFIKLVHLPNGRLLGATVVAARAGEMIHEWSLALDRGLNIGNVAESVHVYPAYSLANQQIAADLEVTRRLSGTMGLVARRLVRLGG